MRNALLQDAAPFTRLIDAERRPPLTTLFYWAGGSAALLTVAALVLAWVHGADRRAIHLWITVAMAAFCADILASLGAYERYTLGWYFGRILAMFASGVLLFVFLGEIISLYRRLGEAVLELTKLNRSLVSLVKKHQHAKRELAMKNDQLERLTGSHYPTALRKNHKSPPRNGLCFGIPDAGGEFHWPLQQTG